MLLTTKLRVTNRLYLLRFQVGPRISSKVSSKRAGEFVVKMGDYPLHASFWRAFFGWELLNIE